MSYKEDFNQWAAEFWEEAERDPDLKECEEFRNHWISQQCEMAQTYQEYNEEKGRKRK